MEAALVSVSLGVVRSLPARLERLLSPAAGHWLHKKEKEKIRLLKEHLRELIDKYLMEMSEVQSPSSTAKCWVKEVRELSYDIDDFLDELVYGLHSDPNNLQSRRQWIADKVSQFRARLRDAIQRHKTYNLDRCRKGSSSLASEDPPLPAVYGLATAPLVGIEGSMEKLEEWLTGDGERNLRVVSIVGLGGVGKTTLAKELYCKIESWFECRAFVRTSKKPDIRKLLSSILVQVRPERPPDASESSNLTDTIRAHLQHKKYFIIIDDLWASSTWDIVCRALPDDKCYSRVLTTTEIDFVARRCCGNSSEYILKMGPLTENESRKIFFSRFPDYRSDSCEQSEVLSDIIRKCGGFPLASVNISSLLARQQCGIEQCNYIRRSLSSNLRTNPSMDGMKQVIDLCYNNLPGHLKACMLYLSTYKEDQKIWKDDLVKQWIAEGFICAKESNIMEEVASRYLDELVNGGMIQAIDIDYNGKVLSCTVHYMILNLIRYKSIEENFVTAIDGSQTKIRLADKVRRLSLLFGDADDAELPANLRLSQVRSLVFFGFFKCLPPIVEFRHLRVLILHLWGDQDNISFDLTAICKLFGLKYLEIVCNVTLSFQTELQGLRYLETLKIDSRVSEIPQEIVQLQGLLHLSLPGDVILPNFIGRLATLRTLGCFDLTSNSADNVLSLGELTNVWDLRLTCSQLQPANLLKNMQHLGSVLSKLRNLKSLTLLSEGSNIENTIEASALTRSIIFYSLSDVSSPPILLEKLELMPRFCILSVLPEWIGKLRLLSILKVEVMRVSGRDIDILEELPALAALSLYVRTAPAERVIFHRGGFPVLMQFAFICSALCIAFEKGAMPNAQRLKVGFNANTIGKYRISEAGLENLAGLEVLAAKIGGAGADELSAKSVKSKLEGIFCRSLSPPIINIQFVGWVFYGYKENSATSETQLIAEEGSSEDIVTHHSDLAFSFGDKETSRAPAAHLQDPAISHCDEEGNSATCERQQIADLRDPVFTYDDGQISTKSATRKINSEDGSTDEDINSEDGLTDEDIRDPAFPHGVHKEINTSSSTQQTAEEIIPVSQAQNDLPRHRHMRPLPARVVIPFPTRGCGRGMMGSLLSGCGGVWPAPGKTKEGQDGLLWWRGLARCYAGQVSIAVVQANNLMEDHCRLESSKLLGTFVGIFDGHGGPEAARFASDHLFPNLQKASSSANNGMTADGIRKAFLDTEEGFLENVSRMWGIHPQIAAVGTCCLVGIVHQGTLLVANLGDSRAVLGRMVKATGETLAMQLSSEHNVCYEEVRQELRAQHPDDPEIVVLKHNVWRVKGLVQFSRSIGDAYLKHAQYNAEPLHSKFRLREKMSRPLLSAEPSVTVHKLQPGDRFVIFASDGLWEHLSSQEAVNIVGNHKPAGSARRLVEAAMREAAKKREMHYSDLKNIDRGIRRHYHDDITAIVLFLSNDDGGRFVEGAGQEQTPSIRYPRQLVDVRAW